MHHQVSRKAMARGMCRLGSRLLVVVSLGLMEIELRNFVPGVGMGGLVFILIHRSGGMKRVMGWECGVVVRDVDQRTPFSGMTGAQESRQRGTLGLDLQNDCWNRLEM